VLFRCLVDGRFCAYRKRKLNSVKAHTGTAGVNAGHKNLFLVEVCETVAVLAAGNATMKHTARRGTNTQLKTLREKILSVTLTSKVGDAERAGQPTKGNST
jgi:ABC-type polysaccharide/polyol phosphate transport system ATPase subunit